jgi:hypothetical protein
MTSEGDPSAPAKKPTPRGALSGPVGLGWNLSVGMALFAFLGYWVDRKRGTGQFWTLWGVFLGLVYGAYEVWKAVREINRQGGSGPRGPESGPGGSRAH